MNKYLRLAETIMAFLGGVLFGSLLVMAIWLRGAMPTQPDPQYGFIIPLIVNGRTIYLTRFYEIVHSVLFWGAVLSFFIAVLIDFYKDPFGRKSGGGDQR